jgi:hypothetical protein
MLGAFEFGRIDWLSKPLLSLRPRGQCKQQNDTEEDAVMGVVVAGNRQVEIRDFPALNWIQTPW